ncbi:hypothetical protein [Isoptericola nanjingensis]
MTFLPFRLFTYYGSSVNMGQRIKYHYYNTPKGNNFLALFLKTFGWHNFSITVVETCSREQIVARENWYLYTFKPLLNVIMTANPRDILGLSVLTRSKISLALTGRKDSDSTRARKSVGKIGPKNHNYGTGPSKATLDAAAEMNGKTVYVYTENSFTLVTGAPFRSIRLAAKTMGIGATTLTTKLDTNKAYKGYYYYTSLRQQP